METTFEKADWHFLTWYETPFTSLYYIIIILLLSLVVGVVNLNNYINVLSQTFYLIEQLIFCTFSAIKVCI